MTTDTIESLTFATAKIGPTAIIFHAGNDWALRLDKDGILANPIVPIDETAKVVMGALKTLWSGELAKLKEEARREEREECAKIVEANVDGVGCENWQVEHIAVIIRSRGDPLAEKLTDEP